MWMDTAAGFCSRIFSMVSSGVPVDGNMQPEYRHSGLL